MSANADLVALWNRTCQGTPIPAIRKVTPRRARWLKQWAALAGDNGVSERAFRAYCADPFIREKGYPFDTFARHMERWRDEAEREVEPKARNDRGPDPSLWEPTPPSEAVLELRRRQAEKGQ